MKYYAYLKQKGEGCDYTIGCAQTLITFDAKNDEEAKAELAKRITEEYQGEYSLSKVILFKEPIDFNLSEVNELAKKSKEDKKKKMEHIKDLEEFERLKKKLGKK